MHAEKRRFSGIDLDESFFDDSIPLDLTLPCEPDYCLQSPRYDQSSIASSSMAHEYLRTTKPGYDVSHPSLSLMFPGSLMGAPVENIQCSGIDESTSFPDEDFMELIEIAIADHDGSEFTQAKHRERLTSTLSDATDDNSSLFSVKASPRRTQDESLEAQYSTERGLLTQYRKAKQKYSVMAKELTEYIGNIRCFVASAYQMIKDRQVSQSLSVMVMRLQDARKAIASHRQRFDKKYTSIGKLVSSSIQDLSFQMSRLENSQKWISLEMNLLSKFLTRAIELTRCELGLTSLPVSSMHIDTNAVLPINSEEGEDTGIHSKRVSLPKSSRIFLKKWFMKHVDNPYPTEKEKIQLAQSISLTVGQITTWFINERGRNRVWKKRRTQES